MLGNEFKTVAVRRFAMPVAAVASAVLMLAGCGDKSAPPGITTVAKVEKCAAGNRPEAALQGQVPAALRAAGFDGFNCNLDLIGQAKGEGAGFSFAAFTDSAGRTCAYVSTTYPFDDQGKPIKGRKSKGVPVIDVTDPAKPVQTDILTTRPMLDPWESLRVNEQRQVLMAAAGRKGGGGPEVDFYDLSQDCRHPQLLFSGPVGTGADGGLKLDPNPLGHEGNFAPDGRTLYLGDSKQKKYYAIDISDLRKPKMMARFDPTTTTLGGGAHGLSISEDGNRAYFVSNGRMKAEDVGNPNAKVNNGFFVIDTSGIQSRKPNPTFKVLSQVPIRQGSAAQHTIPIKVAGKPYLVHVDEAAAGSFEAACAAGSSPFAMARLFAIGDERRPKLVSEIVSEVNDPANCDKVAPDVTNLIFNYGTHYCSVDNRLNATVLACSTFNSGIRVYDIRKPDAPREIAYYNPVGSRTLSMASAHAFGVAPYWKDQWSPGGPDWCSASTSV